MEFRDIITAGILHEISDEAKRKLKKAGKIGAGAAALGGAAYLAHQHLTGNHAEVGGGGPAEHAPGQTEDRITTKTDKANAIGNRGKVGKTYGGGGSAEHAPGQTEDRLKGGGSGPSASEKANAIANRGKPGGGSMREKAEAIGGRGRPGGGPLTKPGGGPGAPSIAGTAGPHGGQGGGVLKQRWT